jgi:hypothetical protein
MSFVGGFPVVVNYSAAAASGGGSVTPSNEFLQLNNADFLQLNGQSLLQLEAA